MEETQYIGEWWLPGEPTNLVSGTLSVSRTSGLTLQLVGRHAPHTIGIPIPIILGKVRIDNGLKDITVADTWITKTIGDGFRGDHNYASGISTLVLLGHHFNSKGEAHFRHVEGKFSYLTSWASELFPSGWGDSNPHWDDQQNQVNLNVNGVSLAISAIGRRSIGHQRTNSYSNYEFEVRTRWDRQEPQSITAWDNNQFKWFEDFLTFCTGRVNVLERLTARVSPDPTEPSVEVLFKPKSPPEDEGPFFGPMLVSFKEIRSNLQEVIDRWLKTQDEIPSVLQLYFADRYHGENLPSSSARFLFLAHALESYHRMRWDESQNLKQQLDDIFDKTLSVSRHIITDIPRFTESVKDTRHYYTHYNSRLVTRKLEGQELERAIRVMIVLLEALFLMEIGFTSHEAHRMLKDMPQFHQALWFKQM